MLDLESWASGSIPTRGNILSLDFLFSRSKASDANIGIIANVVYLWKPRVYPKIWEQQKFLRPINKCLKVQNSEFQLALPDSGTYRFIQFHIKNALVRILFKFKYWLVAFAFNIRSEYLFRIKLKIMSIKVQILRCSNF